MSKRAGDEEDISMQTPRGGTITGHPKAVRTVVASLERELARNLSAGHARPKAMSIRAAPWSCSRDRFRP
jgi:hypothetical protein